MKLLFRRLIVVLLVLWLPYQAVASVVMPVCDAHQEFAGTQPELYGHGSDSPDESLMAGHDDHGWMNPGDIEHGMQHDDAVVGDCDACSLCHLMCTSAVPVAEAKAHHPPGGNGRQAPVHESFVSHAPEQLKRPPLAFLA